VSDAWNRLVDREVKYTARQFRAENLRVVSMWDWLLARSAGTDVWTQQGESQVSMTPDGWMNLAMERGRMLEALTFTNVSLKKDVEAIDANRNLWQRKADERGEQNRRLLEQVETLIRERGRFGDAIREFVAADNEMEKYMADCNPEDRLTRAPVFDRFDAAVAALKEAVK